MFKAFATEYTEIILPEKTVNHEGHEGTQRKSID
jgi:hypothetical protein